MPLVPLDTVKAWYQTDSWVYKHFSYLFSNPLWTKRVPGGFSLCPYFWLALFSLIVFRPFVWTLQGLGVFFLLMGRLFAPLLRALGFAQLLSWVADKPTDGEVGRLVTITFWITSSLALLAIVGYNTYQGLCVVVSEYAEAGVVPLFWLPLVNVLVLGAGLLYEFVRPHTRCRPEVYPLVLAPLSLMVAGFMYPTLLGDVLSSIGYVFEAIFSMLVWLVGQAIYWTGWGIGTAVMWLWEIVSQSFVFVFTAALVWMIAIVLGLGFMALIGYLYSRFEKSPERVKQKELDKARDNVFNYMGRWAYQYSPYSGETALSRYCTYARHFEATRKFVDGLVLNPAWADRPPTELQEEAARLGRLMLEAEQAKDREAAQRAAARNRWLGDACERITRGLAIVVMPPVRLIGAAFRVIGKGIGWLAKQGWTFLCLLWELGKARKQGACPYLRFEAPPAPKPEVTTQK